MLSRTRYRTDGEINSALRVDPSCRWSERNKKCYADRRALRRAARQELQQIPFHVDIPEHGDGQRRRKGAGGDNMLKEQEIIHMTADLHLSAMTRPAAQSRSSTPMAEAGR